MSDETTMLAAELRALRERLERLERLEDPIMTGTWVPTYYGHATPGTTVYALQQGTYVRIKKAVLFTLTVVWTSATGTGIGRFSLPFPSASTNNQYFSASVRTSSIAFVAGSPQVDLAPGAQGLSLRYPTSNAAVTDIAVETDGGNAIISGWYLAA